MSKTYVIPASQVKTGYRRTTNTRNVTVYSDSESYGPTSTSYSTHNQSDSNRIAYEYATSRTLISQDSWHSTYRETTNMDLYRIDLMFDVSDVPVNRIQTVKLRSTLTYKNNKTPRGYYVSSVGTSGSTPHYNPEASGMTLLATNTLSDPVVPYDQDVTLSGLSNTGWYCLWNKLNATFANNEILKFDLSKFYLVITTDETDVNTYTVSYDKGTYGTGDNATATKTEDVVLTLSGAIFTRSDYTQTGWSINADGSTKDYDLEGNYTANADITLYPYWTHGNVNPNSVLFIMTENGLQAIL